MSTHPSAHAFALNTSFPVSFSQFVPCANNGQGEVVAISGNEHVTNAATFDNAGVEHDMAHLNFQGLTGVGQTTGDKYQGTGTYTFTLVLTSSPTGPPRFTVAASFNMIGQGPGNNLLMHELVHFLRNPDGTFTVFVSNMSMECK